MMFLAFFNTAWNSSTLLLVAEDVALTVCGWQRVYGPMASLSAHLLQDYESLRVIQQPDENEQQIIQSGAMEYNALVHGHGAPQTTRPPAVAFSTFSQASLAHGYSGGASTSALGLADSSFGNMPASSVNGRLRDSAMVRMETPLQMPGITVQQLYALQQKREEEQALKTANAIATLQAKLNQRLGPEYISQRPGPGGGVKLTYAEGWKIINLANEVFGFNGWSSSVSNLSVDFIDYNQESQRYNVGVTAVVRVTLRDGTSHEDVGYGLLENCKSKGMALDKCKKEAITDALKRTLRSFGNVLGNCLYDKDYIREVIKMKVPATKFESSELHRRKEFAGESSNAAPKGPIASTSNAPRTSMPPPPPPTRTPQNTITKPGPAVTNSAAASTSSTVNKPPASTSTATRTPDSIKRQGTDESLYAFGSDDDALFEGFSVGDETGSTILNLDQPSERSIVLEKRPAAPS
ncbi:14101_t:CDS:2, partial [Acaulospora colombiana]